jgi:hypothetical protein
LALAGPRSPRLDGLTDDEYRWEPVAECWNMRPRGTGTIAWRLAHLTVGVFGARAASHFGGRAFDYQTYDYPWAAEPAL